LPPPTVRVRVLAVRAVAVVDSPGEDISGVDAVIADEIVHGGEEENGIRPRSDSFSLIR
jgi:hypothetical protein